MMFKVEFEKDVKYMDKWWRVEKERKCVEVSIICIWSSSETRTYSGETLQDIKKNNCAWRFFTRWSFDHYDSLSISESNSAMFLNQNKYAGV